MSDEDGVDSNVGLIQASIFLGAALFAAYRTGLLVKSCFDRSMEVASAYQNASAAAKSYKTTLETRKSVPFAISTNRNSLLSQDSVQSGDSDKTIINYKRAFRIFVHLLSTPKAFFHVFMITYMALQIANGFLIYHDAA
jgi:hypothetical protein